MSSAQFWTIMLTGGFVVAASAAGHYIGGAIANQRAQHESDLAQRDRLLEVKRALFVRAIAQATRSELRQKNESDMQLVLELSILAPEVATAFANATNVRAQAEDAGDEDDETKLADEFAKSILAMEEQMRRALGTDETIKIGPVLKGSMLPRLRGK